MQVKWWLSVNLMIDRLINAGGILAVDGCAIALSTSYQLDQRS